VGHDDDYDDLATDVLGKTVEADDSDDDPFRGGDRRKQDDDDKEDAYCVFDFRRGNQR